MTVFLRRAALAALAFSLFPRAGAADLMAAQKAYQRKDAAALSAIASSMGSDPLAPWVQGWALLSEPRPDPGQLSRAARLNEGSLMQRRLLERSAWERLAAGDASGALADLRPYAESELSAAGQCALWSAQGSLPREAERLERALASSYGAPACARAAALAANEPAWRDSLMAALAGSGSATRKALLSSLAAAELSDEARAFAQSLSSPSSPLQSALLAKNDPGKADGIPASLPRLRQMAWSLAAQGAFNARRSALAPRLASQSLNKDGAWALFRLSLWGGQRDVSRRALKQLAALDPESSRRMFWSALLDDPAGADAQTLMGRNNYHAFALRSALGRPLFAMSPAKAHKPAASCSSYAQRAPILLARAGASAEAGQAWAHELNKTDEAQRRCMAAAAREAGAHALALAAWGRVPPASPSDLRSQWEIGERQAIESAASQRGLAPSLFGALARQESRFDPRAISTAGAMGLTQLMPKTAAELARKEKMRSPNLFDPSVNASLGARYFKEKLDRLGDARWALSAYNAGESRARSWRQDLGQRPWVAAVELIPFEETRGYVERGYEGWAAHEELARGAGDRVLQPAAASAKALMPKP